MDMEEGVFYAIEWGDGTFGNVKVLKVDETLVHIRLYPNTYTRNPVGLSPDELEAQAIRNEQPKIGHLPISRELFESWNPAPWVRQAVQPDELDRYQIWLENKGGYFDLPGVKTARELQKMVLQIADG